MTSTKLLGEPEVWALMCERFPWIVEERGEIGKGLLHLEFAALRHGLEAAATAGDATKAIDILEFVEDVYKDRDRLRPEVVNAVDVSFVEDLYLGGPVQAAFVAPLLLPRTLERWREVAEYYDQGSGSDVA